MPVSIIKTKIYKSIVNVNGKFTKLKYVKAAIRQGDFINPKNIVVNKIL